MPLYEFRNKETGEVREQLMSIAACELFLLENPSFELVISAPRVVSGVTGITHKNDGGFKDMMSRIANANPHSPLAKEYGDKGIKASKTREAVERQKQRQIKAMTGGGE